MVKYNIMMGKYKIHKIWALVLALVLMLTSMNVSSFAYTSQYGTIKASNVNIRSGPGTSYSKIGKLNIGNQVAVYGEEQGTDGQIWCNITWNNGADSGYVAKAYIGMGSVFEGVSDENFETMLTNQGFPESYKPYLRALHQQYPNWSFQAVKTGIDWETAVANESVVGRNLVHKDSKSSWKSTADGAFDWNSNYWPGFDGDSWKAASEDIIRYYMDPRNFLDSEYVFQFLDHSYNSEIHTYQGLEAMVKGTFMESRFTGALGDIGQTSTVSGSSAGSAGPVTVGNVMLVSPGQAISAASSGNGPGGSDSISGAGPGGAVSVTDSGSATYVDMLMKAAASSGVNPYVLVSMIIQEQGRNGNTSMVSGNSGVYNFYNTEAYSSNGMSANERGLWWAGQSGSYGRPWDTKEKAIVGGAKFYGEGYVMKKQNTFYLKKFNVTSNNTYKHQYMANVRAAADEGYNLSKAYTSEIRMAAHDFEIPVYNNMPETPAPLPTGDGSPNNKLYDLGVDGFAITPTFNPDTLSYDLIVDKSVVSINVSAAPCDSSASVSGTGTFNLVSGTNKIEILVTAQNKTTRTYVLNVIKQNNGPTYSSGIGGISAGGPGVSVISTPGTSTQTSGTANVVTIDTTGVSGSTAQKSSSEPTVVLIGPGQ